MKNSINAYFFLKSFSSNRLVCMHIVTEKGLRPYKVFRPAFFQKGWLGKIYKIDEKLTYTLVEFGKSGIGG